MTTLTPELRQALAAAGGGPLRIEDPETHQVYVLIQEERLQHLQELPQDEVDSAYPAVDEVFREGWDTPEMAEYDDYEAHRR